MVKRQQRCSSEQEKKEKILSFSVNTLQLDDTAVLLSDSVKSLGVLLNSTLSMESFISQTAKSCCYQLRRISSLRKYFSNEEATVKLATSLILSRLNYCSSLLSGLPASSIHSLRREVFFSTEATVKLVTSLILSRLNY